MKRRTLIALGIVALCAAPGIATATNGYFSHGYGMKAKGMGGAATALSQDTFGGANNPASMVWVGDRLDVGVELFSPRRSASRTGSGILDGAADSERDLFPIPEFGYNQMLRRDLSLGVSVYGNGGMNTQYPASSSGCGNLLCGTTRLGVDLMQLVVAPTLSFKLSDHHSLGVSPLIAYQRFRAEGLQAFGGSSSSPGDFTNRGYDDSFGAGVRFGWMVKVTELLTVGAAYATRINMSKFEKYRGLFAEQGDFDIPENYNVGFAYRVTSRLLLAADYQRINYSAVPAVGNPSNNPVQFGTDTGPGFGWADVNVWKVGVEYTPNDRWTVRGGYNHGDNPIQGRDVTVNIISPGVITDHLTAGATYTTATGGQLTLMYMHAFEKSVAGASTFGGTDAIRMHQDSFGIAYGWKM
jgi:long-chain fatty acid transport protein